MPISNYLRGLREKVGSDLILVPAVTAVCRDDQGRILLARHHDYDQWALPGGTIDPDETPANAAVREMWEESGLLVEPTRILGIYGGPAFTITYPNGDQIATVDTVFECRVIGGNLAADGEEVSELRYFTQAEVAGMAFSSWMEVVRDNLFGAGSYTCFQPPVWTPPADGVRKGGISDYVRNLRRWVGQDLLLMPAAGALVFDQQGHVLLQQRIDNQQWSAPVGGIDPGESPSDAVVREVWEETGVLVEPVRVLGVYGGPRFRHTHPNGDRTASLAIIFECRALDGAPTPDGIESMDAKFVPAQEALTLLSQRWQQRFGVAVEMQRNAHFEVAT